MKKDRVELIYGHIVVAFITLVFFDTTATRIIGGAALLLACYHIGRMSNSKS